MLLQFAWDDIIGTVRAWGNLKDDCDVSFDVDQLRQAGNKFMKKLGKTGFDILMFIVMVPATFMHDMKTLDLDGAAVMGDELWTRFNPDADQLWYYRSLVDVFRRVSRSPLVDELDRVVTELERLTRHTPDTDA